MIRHKSNYSFQSYGLLFTLHAQINATHSIHELSFPLFIIQTASMQEQPLTKDQLIDSTYLKPPSKSHHQSPPILSNNSRMIISSRPIEDDNQNIEELQESNSRVEHRPVSKKPSKATSEDFVELPKLNFMQQSWESRAQSSEMINDVRYVEGGIQSSNIKSRIEIEQSDDTEQKESQNGQEYASWNIHNINIIPSRNNYLEQSDYDHIAGNNPNPLALINNNIDSTPSRINIQKNQTRQRKKSENAKEEERRIFKERERRQRERNIQIVTGFLSGKASFIWLFILSASIEDKSINEVRQIYKDHIENDYEVPICRSYEHALKFLTIQSCFFKIVADIESSETLIQDSPNHKNIIAIYIYNPKKQAGINKSFELKKATKKIKGMFMDLREAIKQAEEEIQNEAKFVMVQSGLEKERTKLRFPSFLLLTGHDTTEVTSYRLCLYGALKLKEKKQRLNYLKEFTDMVEMRYAEVPKELAHLEEYKKIDHTEENSEKKARDIINFYVRETFYYALTNSILRLSHSSEEFRPCAIPFNETYHAIKHFYLRYRKEVGSNSKKIVTYRGAKLRNNDAANLEIGSYIQLLGFTSTSLKRSQAQKFMDNDSYLFEIIVETSAQNDQQMLYDHGFVEINRFGLANQAYKNEEEILFNALNVFKVVSLDLTSATRKITLQYGGIINLLRTKPDRLSAHEKAVIANYQYCTRSFNQIEDDGDVLLLAQEHDRCIEYYQGRIEEGDATYKVYAKIANAQLENGDLQQAYNNALLSMQELNKHPENNKNVKQNYAKYECNKNIFNAKEDFIHFQATIEKYIRILGDDWFAQAKLLKERGEKGLKIGDLENSHEDLLKSKEIIKEKEASFEKRRKEIRRRYMLRSFCCMCSRSATHQIEEQREMELLKIESDQVNFQNRKDEIHELSLSIETLLKELAEQTGDKQLYAQSQEQAKIHFNSMSKSNQTSSPIVVAKFLAMQANLLENSSNNQQQYEELMEQAIATVKKQDVFHQNLGVYHKVLGSRRRALIKKKLLLQPLAKEHSETGEQHDDDTNYIKIKNEETLTTEAKYNYQVHQGLYEKSKGSFTNAAENIAYNKGPEHSDYLTVRNEIIELDFDFSRLNESQKIAKETTEIQLSNCHTEGAKCYLLLAKICLAKGQLKKGFRNIERAYEILKASLVKVDNKEYNNLFLNHPYYMDISLQKVKVFNKQLKHDLALKELHIVKKIAKIKVENMHSRTILATIYEEEAEILICLGETLSFEEYIKRAIEIRSEEIGKYNIPNAISYANLYKYMRGLNDSEDALKYHHRATEIFSRFPSDHPNAWIIHLSNALHFHEKKDTDEFISEMEYCIRVTSKRYSFNHITTLKIKLQYGKILASLQQHDKALKVLLELEALVEEALSESLKGEQIDKETDDEKLPLRKHLCNQLRQLYGQMDIGSHGSLAEIKKYEQKLTEYQQLGCNTNKLMKPALK